MDGTRPAAAGRVGPAAVIFDFHGVLIDSALPFLGLPELRDDPTVAEALGRLETGRIGLAGFLDLLPVKEPTGRSLRVRARREVVGRIPQLRTQGLRVALLTNSFRGFGGVRASAGVPDKLFDAVIESWQHGVRKPDPAIYRIATEALDLPAERCVFLDDELPNVAAAARMGMEAVHVTTETEVLAALDHLIAPI